mmetsp:Transcript_17967/g.27236  ORF Transcript_17967/g.27236 Transcript_17967/m.27236 type:complete len:111 (+) Transcript_17967:924-1256(+)
MRMILQRNSIRHGSRKDIYSHRGNVMQSLSSKLSHFNVPHRSIGEQDISSRTKISPKTQLEAYQSRKFFKDCIRNTLSSIIIGLIVILPVQPSSQLGIHAPLYVAPCTRL